MAAGAQGFNGGDDKEPQFGAQEGFCGKQIIGTSEVTDGGVINSV